ncbi:MAG: AAA family ATPase [Acidobacteriota bacterium]|nr:AAA family ATPase [Acidobacteriota bacterium]
MQPIPIGISNFKKLRTADYAFIDKSMLIADVVRSGAEVILLPRPRRFGKTLNLSMLHHFFDRSDPGGAVLFEGLTVCDHPDVMKHQGRYPVVFLTFKDVKFEDYDSCYQAIARIIARLFLTYKTAIEKAQPEHVDADMVHAIIDRKAHPVDLQDALALLTNLIERGTGIKPIVLLDEYDAPIHAGYRHGFYNKIISFMRNLLSGAFKDNDHLEKGVVTGILRIAKESIFSGFNNPDIHTILDEPYARHFGFTEEEVSNFLARRGLTDREAEIRSWYNGYRFGGHTVYNPWSIMKMAADPGAPLRSYWVNTSDNQLIQSLITKERAVLPEDLEILLRGDVLPKELDVNIVLNKMTSKSIWSMLTFSGYLKPETLTVDEGRYKCDLAVPNKEVRLFFEETVRNWIDEQAGPKGLSPLIQALLAEDMERLAAHFAEVVKSVLSYHDTAGSEPERVYHAFMLGLLVDLSGQYRIMSNRESGYGRYDINMIPKDQNRTGFVLEFKRVKERPAEETADEALAQIKERDYAAELRSAGVTRARAIGIAVDGKRTCISSALL